jgi:hypothetical protein
MNTPSEDRNQDKPSWTVRRRIIFSTLLFCVLTVGYCLYKAEDLKIYETAITMSFILAGSTIGSYVFGAVWDDKRK